MNNLTKALKRISKSLYKTNSSTILYNFTTTYRSLALAVTCATFLLELFKFTDLLHG